MSPEPIAERTLWARFVSGDELTPDERAQFGAWIDSEELADELQADIETDRLLRQLPQLEASHDAFVERTWGLATATQRAVQPSKPLLLVGLGAAAALVLVASGWFLGAQNERNGALDAIVPIHQPSFVTRSGHGGAQDERLGSGALQLPQGITQLDFDNGASFTVDGPADLEILSPEELYMVRGKTVVRLPNTQRDFIVRTPTSRIKDAEANFSLLVSDSGDTELEVERGLVSLEPGNQGQWPGRVQKLSPKLLRKAHVYALHRTPENLVLASEARGGDQRFSGLLVSHGRVLEYEMPQLFARASQKVAEVSRSKPEFFLKRWRDAAEEGEALQVHLPTGPTIQLNTVSGLNQLALLSANQSQGQPFGEFRVIHDLQGFEFPNIKIEMPSLGELIQGREPRVRGLIVAENGRWELSGEPDVRKYAEIRLRALKDLDLPVEPNH